MTSPALLLAAGAVGLLLWQALATERWTSLRRETADPRCGALFVAGFLVNGLLLAGLVALAGGAVSDDGDPLTRMGLERVVAVQTAANLATVGVLLVVARLAGVRSSALGLRRDGGPSALVAALAAWLAFLPALAAVTLLNQWVIERLGVDADTSQAYLTAFAEDAAAGRSPIVWGGMVLAIPLAEEVLYRGALFGGLLAWVGRTPALVVSGLLFGIGHDPGAWLPISVLGIYLAWLYHRTGSLTVPVLVHALQNGSTLLFAQLFRETLP